MTESADLNMVDSAALRRNVVLLFYQLLFARGYRSFVFLFKLLQRCSSDVSLDSRSQFLLLLCKLFIGSVLWLLE